MLCLQSYEQQQILMWINYEDSSSADTQVLESIHPTSFNDLLAKNYHCGRKINLHHYPTQPSDPVLFFPNL